MFEEEEGGETAKGSAHGRESKWGLHRKGSRSTQVSVERLLVLHLHRKVLVSQFCAFESFLVESFRYVQEEPRDDPAANSNQE
jgi:hypothetical protein